MAEETTPHLDDPDPRGPNFNEQPPAIVEPPAKDLPNE